MALQSQLFRGDKKLEAAAVSDPDHILQGARGEHVRKIQLALIQLDGAALVPDGVYGPNTAKAVASYKRKRKILNYQGRIDDIVGIKTTASLDSGMLKREQALAKGLPSLLLAFGLKIPPVPSATKFRIRLVSLARSGKNPHFPFRIYQVVDTQNRLSAFYTTVTGVDFDLLRISFSSLKVIDKGAFSDFTTAKPAPVTAFQPEPCFEVISKKFFGPGRERVELSMPVFQTGGLTLHMEGLLDDNIDGFTISGTGILMLIEQTPRNMP